MIMPFVNVYVSLSLAQENGVIRKFQITTLLLKLPFIRLASSPSSSLYLFVKECWRACSNVSCKCARYYDGGLDLSLQQYYFRKEVITDNLRGTKFQT